MKRQIIAQFMLCAFAAAGSAAATNADAAAANSQDEPLGLPHQGALVTVPLGDLVGGAQSTAAAHIDNPKESEAGAGRELFIRLNCADCHGFTAKGAMGPSLVDKYWRYGGTPAAIYKSIFEGRPKGMPAWGQALSPNDIWQLVAYIQSLNGAFPPDFYQPSLQGDRQGEEVAPEIDFEQSINGSPRYEAPSGANPSAQSASSKK